MTVFFWYICATMAFNGKVYFCSDLHFSHPSQLYFHPERRDAAGISLEELQTLPKDVLIKRHDEWLIDLWNSTVKREDFVYHLGDFCLGTRERTEKILQKLKELSISPLNPNGTFKTFFAITEEIINAFHNNKIDN